MLFKKIVIASAISATLASSVAEAHVSYHLSDTGLDEHWRNNETFQGSWTGGSPIDKGYVVGLPITWLANIHGNDTNYEVSAADAITEGAAEGYELSSIYNNWRKSDSFQGGGNWGHTLDFGLIDMDVAGDLTIEIKADGNLSDFTPGFTVWQGWGNGGGDKHSAWNFISDFSELASNDPTFDFFGEASQSLYVTGISKLGEASTTVSGGTATLTLSNLASGKYFLFIGGNGTNFGDETNQTYMANISVSSVPVPAAVWLMGSAMLGLAGIRRKAKT